MELRGAEALLVVRLEEGLGVDPEQPRVARQVAAQEHRDREEVEPFRLQVLDEVAAEAHPFRDVRDRVPRRLARTAQGRADVLRDGLPLVQQVRNGHRGLACRHRGRARPGPAGSVAGA